MSDLERTNQFRLQRQLAPIPDRRPRPGVLADLNKERGLDLTPDERMARRRNRRWMLALFIPSAAVIAAALVANAVAHSNEPKGPRITAPAGYKVVNDGYFAYVVPSSWSTNPEFTDQAGDVDTSGPTGWAAENIRYFKSTPTLGEAPPASLRAFGMPRPTPFVLSSGHAITVPGASGAYAYQMIRPGGFQALAVDAWSDATGVELWLVVDGPPPVTAQVLSSLRAGESS